MKTSVETGLIAEALAKAQGEMSNPEKNRTVDYTSPKGRVKYNYSDLCATFDCARMALSKNGLSHTSGMHGSILYVRLTHLSGEWYQSEMELPQANDMKALGGNLTYGRRYLFQGLVGITGDEDMDDEIQPTNERLKERPAYKPVPVPGPKAVIAPKSQPTPDPAQLGRTVQDMKDRDEEKEVAPLIQNFTEHMKGIQGRIDEAGSTRESLGREIVRLAKDLGLDNKDRDEWLLEYAASRDPKNMTIEEMQTFKGVLLAEAGRKGVVV